MAVSRLLGVRAFTGSPPMYISPASGLSKPAIILSVVVLPQPLGPKSVTKLPGFMSRVTSFTA